LEHPKETEEESTMSPQDKNKPQQPQTGSDDVLTQRESDLIDAALKFAYKPALFNSEHQKDLQEEKKRPLGTHGSIKDREKVDGLEAEITTLSNLEKRGLLKLDNSVVMEKIKAVEGVMGIERKVKSEGDNIDPKDAEAFKQARSRLEAIDVKMAEVEDKTPMASTFRAARKVEENGSIERWSKRQ
jgi:hypothetical protein